jgi:hypothetical protein
MGRTVLSPRGIRTGTFFGHHSCHWSEVAEIESVNFSVSRAPRDLNGPDPQLKAKFQEIRDYWANAQGQIQTSGN